MLNKIVNAVLSLITIFILINPILSIDEEENTKESILEWEAVKSAKGYHVQIRNNKKKLVVDEKITATKYTLNLPEGEYEERLGVYNKFGKIAGYSDWEKISINRVYNPQIENINKTISNDSSPQTIEIKGNYFTSDSIVILKSNTQKITILEIIYKNEKRLDVVLKIDDSIHGNYDLVIINPRNKKAIVENFLHINDKKIELALQRESNSTKEKKISIKVIPEKNSLLNGFRSALFPGLGQYNKNQKIKAGIYMFAFLGSLSYFATNVSEYSDYKNKYDRTTNEGILLSRNQQNLSNGLILYNLNQSNQFLKQAESSAATASQALALVNIIYLVNILDAIYSKTEPDVSIQPGFQLHSKYSFQTFSPGIPSNSQYELGLKWNF